NIGFKMFYSIHPKSEMPQQLDTGFSLHFDCNLETECTAGEDERDCPYTSAVCGPGFIDAGNKCYRYVTVRKKITWDDAYQQCRSFGERLVSPRTPSEWQTFRARLEYGKKMCSVYVGLRSSPSHMHAMYRDVWQWADQTMAYYINILEQKLSKPTCAYILPVDGDMLQPVACGAPLYVRFLLCEKDKVFNKTSIVQFSGLNEDNMAGFWNHVAVTVCPEGHMTRTFLSCDASTHCGVSKPLMACPTQHSGEIPMFVCDNGVQTLHYTLVCDHRQDCVDGSDESFCEFASCPERQCRSQQCVSEDEWCDGMRHCSDGSDEECGKLVSSVAPSVPPPA
ncbi:hypothetical protein BaRGS_00021335, partial [Batillaria attramentaria]